MKISVNFDLKVPAKKYGDYSMVHSSCAIERDVEDDSGENVNEVTEKMQSWCRKKVMEDLDEHM